MSSIFKALMLASVFLWLCGSLSAQGLDYAYRESESLSDDQKLTRATELIDKMKSTLKLALTRLEAAKEAKDIIQLNCLNEKLSAIKGLLKISEQADVSMRESMARKDLELANHEFTKISIAGVRIDNFRAGVEGCVGEASQYLGQTERKIKLDDDIRDDEPLMDPSPDNQPPPSPPADGYTVIFKNADGETKKLYLSCTKKG